MESNVFSVRGEGNVYVQFRKTSVFKALIKSVHRRQCFCEVSYYMHSDIRRFYPIVWRNEQPIDQHKITQGCEWPSYWTQHPEKTPSPAETDRQSVVQGVWSKRGNLSPHSL